MNYKSSKIDELIKYLIRVFNGTELTSESKKEQEKYGDYTKEDEVVRSQDFFILTKDLDKILEPWFGGFKNDEELNKTLKFKLGALKKLSFPKGKEVFFLVKDKTNHNNVIFTKQRHNDYSHIIHSHLIKVFINKLKIRENLIKVFINKLKIREKDVVVAKSEKTSNSKISGIDSKMWNDSCFELFEYLKENYYDKKPVELMTIWFFLKDLDSDKYVFRSNKGKYIDFIKTHYEIEIKNKDRSINWDKKEKTLNELYSDFKNEQKKHENK